MTSVQRLLKVKSKQIRQDIKTIDLVTQEALDPNMDPWDFYDELVYLEGQVANLAYLVRRAREMLEKELG